MDFASFADMVSYSMTVFGLDAKRHAMLTLGLIVFLYSLYRIAKSQTKVNENIVRIISSIQAQTNISLEQQKAVLELFLDKVRSDIILASKDAELYEVTIQKLASDAEVFLRKLCIDAKVIDAVSIEIRFCSLVISKDLDSGDLEAILKGRINKAKADILKGFE